VISSPEDYVGKTVEVEGKCISTGAGYVEDIGDIL
jgi:hypothetical protein